MSFKSCVLSRIRVLVILVAWTFWRMRINSIKAFHQLTALSRSNTFWDTISWLTDIGWCEVIDYQYFNCEVLRMDRCEASLEHQAFCLWNWGALNKQLSSPGHSTPAVQFLSSVNSPVHSAPPFVGGGLVQLRLRSDIPTPQVAEQLVQELQVDQWPFTVWASHFKTIKNSFLWNRRRKSHHIFFALFSFFRKRLFKLLPMVLFCIRVRWRLRTHY